MPHLTAYHLAFKSGLHVGQGAESLEETLGHLPADTLFAALVQTWRHLGEDVEAWLQPFTQEPPNPPFRLTSGFPFAGQVRFYPMPVDLSSLFSTQTLRDARYGKRLKRIRYLSEGLVRKAQAGESLDAYLFPPGEDEEPDRGVALQGGTLWLLRDEIEGLPESLRNLKNGTKRPPRALRFLPIWQEQEVPRVTVNRINQGSTIYHSARVVFAPGCGLWFGVEWLRPNEELRPNLSFKAAFEHVLHTLEQQGLGGERTSGYGAFTVTQTEDITLASPEPGQCGLLLSRYHPRTQEEIAASLQKGDSAISLVAVGGWLHSMGQAAQRRKRVWLIGEGSLVTWAEQPVLGNLCDVRPEYHSQTFPHPVYRYGLALAITWPGIQQA
ncbi:type III-A CRISPR-associated RAMP protein Csm4 [Thermanaerothrix sp. 4228-RoL]|uniref:CRISPR system Cms protein Csm4 n=1 Tax=Thermanaerothrix solaris TaxID=3058434 RepID=A0ABU3NQE3_9CHLR|nr:type III-A CRISPR-associated RAMP protein Csm4 [Thermanaerothrix sp. 4228-RoL]MDT8898615.1 type III-A CRISPR-associated RAMP protein Csm4 [Thermanaerothrix sp. 4228-RoL]